MDNESILSKRFSSLIKKDKEIIAVLLFGSFARKEPYRDIDICIVLDKKYKNLEMSRKALQYASLLPGKFDISIFQQLPLYIRIRVLKEGMAIFCRDESLLYNLAYSTIKEFNLFEKHYNAYLERVRNG